MVYWNIAPGYGEERAVILEEYERLNPEGTFEQWPNSIISRSGRGEGMFVVVAELREVCTCGAVFKPDPDFGITGLCPDCEALAITIDTPALLELAGSAIF